MNRAFAALMAVHLLSACSSTLMPHQTDGEPLVMLPAALAGIEDGRGRFREIMCEVSEARGDKFDNYQPCESALTRVGAEPPGTGAPVNLKHAARKMNVAIVPGIGWGCFEEWLNPYEAGTHHVEQFGYRARAVPVEALSSGATNARYIREYVLGLADEGAERDLVLVGYSKGATDILRALVDFPEIRNHVTAVVSIAGSIGGSALANSASQSQLELLTHWPGAECDEGDGKGLDSLRPDVRRDWLAKNPLPGDIHYYSVVTLPDPERISSVLRPAWRKLSKIDGRNDSQVMFYDQLIPHSTLVAYVNADHWAVAVPVEREHKFIARTLANRSSFPREVMLEAILRFVEEDLER
jgi:hypothetical protein